MIYIFSLIPEISIKLNRGGIGGIGGSGYGGIDGTVNKFEILLMLQALATLAE